MVVLQLVICLFAPYLFIRLLDKRPAIGKVLSPVVCSYIIGMIWGNFLAEYNNGELAQTVASGSLLLALPMLLYQTDFKAWIKSSRSSLISFSICVFSGVLASAVAAVFLHTSFEKIWELAGMLTGVYTGGTPNLFAIGIALNVPEEQYVLLSAADVFCGGIYLLLLMSVIPKFLQNVLPAFDVKRGTHNEVTFTLSRQIKKKEWPKVILLTLAIIGLAIGLSFLATSGIDETLVILVLCLAAIAASFNRRVSTWTSAYPMGDYLLLVFCVAVGMSSEFSTLWAQGASFILFTGLTMLLTVIMHFLLSACFKIDRDTTLIMNTAAIYGPVFIGQIASVLKNRALILPGILASLVGLAIGTPLGILIARLLEIWLNT